MVTEEYFVIGFTISAVLGAGLFCLGMEVARRWL